MAKGFLETFKSATTMITVEVCTNCVNSNQSYVIFP